MKWVPDVRASALNVLTNIMSYLHDSWIYIYIINQYALDTFSQKINTIVLYMRWTELVIAWFRNEIEMCCDANFVVQSAPPPPPPPPPPLLWKTKKMRRLVKLVICFQENDKTSKVCVCAPPRARACLCVWYDTKPCKRRLSRSCEMKVFAQSLRRFTCAWAFFCKCYVWEMGKSSGRQYLKSRCSLDAFITISLTPWFTQYVLAKPFYHYNDVIMGAMASQITSLTIVYSAVYLGENQSSASLAFVRGIHRWPVNSPHKGPVTRKMFPFDDVIMH